MASKLYLALVHGHPAWEQLACTGAVGEDSTDERGFRMALEGEPGCTKPLKASTDLFVVARGTLDGRPVTKLLMRPRDGRRHQLRLHAKAAGHPIVGDTAYCGDTVAVRMMLHAWRLRLPLPRSKAPLCVSTADPFPIAASPEPPNAAPNSVVNSPPPRLPPRSPPRSPHAPRRPSPLRRARSAADRCASDVGAASSGTTALAVTALAASALALAALGALTTARAPSTATSRRLGAAAAAAAATLGAVAAAALWASDSARQQAGQEQRVAVPPSPSPTAEARPPKAAEAAAGDSGSNGGGGDAGGGGGSGGELRRVVMEHGVMLVDAEASFETTAVLAELRGAQRTAAPNGVVFRCIAYTQPQWAANEPAPSSA